jgi:Cd2+/Zn2+-exporting ATPase
MTTTQHITLPVTGLDCIDCARALEGGVGQLDGVLSATLNFAASTLAVDYDPKLADAAGVVARIREMGYDISRGPELVFDLQGLDCADCADKLQQAITALPQVLEAQVVFATAQMRVRALSADGLEAAIVKRSAELGYGARPHSRPAQAQVEARRGWWTSLYEQRRKLLTVVAVAFLALASLMRILGVEGFAPNVAYTLAILSGGVYVARSGWAVLRTTRSLDMNALMTIAAIGAVAIGEWAEGATAMVLFAVGNTLETMTMDRARQAIRRLVELSPKEATRVHNDHSDRVPVEELQVGDLIEVKPGEQVPMDGVVTQGRSDVNQAPITGESTPVDVEVGSSVYAGSINGRGALLVRVTRLASDNTLARIVQMVQEAQARRAPSQRFVDTFARYYTPAVIALAAGIALLPPLLWAQPLHPWLYRALVLLVISCPCALVISTPVAIVSAISSAARRGVLIKGGAHLEAIGRVRAVAFDKTGTLTEGRAAVTHVEVLRPPSDGGDEPMLTPERLLALTASIEAHSQHPVARAIWEEARHRGLAMEPVSDYTEITGFGAQAQVNGQTYYVGKHRLFCERVPHQDEVCARIEEVEGQGKTAVLVSNEHDVLGLIAVADRVRDTSAEVVQALRATGMEDIVLLSGDNELTATAIAAQVGIQNVQAELLPEDKVEAVEKLLAGNGHMAMVGDGVNDAPALARATVGIAMGAAGSDAALETADIVLMSDDLTRIPYVIRLGRRTLQNIRQNIVLSLLIKALFLSLAVSGLATLWMAVFADMGTSLLVTLNGMRLLRE